MFRQNIRIYRKLRYSKGFGINSPFTFTFVTRIVEERLPYYAFDRIEYLRQKILRRADSRSKFVSEETQDRKYGALLFRVVNYLKCRKILQIGSSAGIMLLYLASPSRACHCFSVEERKDVLKAAKETVGEYGLENVLFIEAEYSKGSSDFLMKNPDVDLIFLNSLDNLGKTKELLEEILSSVRRSVVLVDNLRNDSRVSFFLELLKEDGRISLSLDLQGLWILFIGYKINKQHHKVYFDYGKRPNLYKKRRQGLYLFGDRGKSRENGSPDRSLWKY